MAMVGFGGGLSWAAMVVQWTGARPTNRFGTQRRQASYALAALRARVRRWGKRLGETFHRIRPQRGRLQRLRHKIDKSDFV